MGKIKKILVVVLSLFMALTFLTGCGGGDEDAKDKVYAVGDVINVGNGVKLQVNKVTRSKGGEFDTPAKGKDFVIVNVIIKNEGEETASYNFLDFSMQNSKGQVDSTTLTLEDVDNSLDSGDLAASGIVSGNITFEQPKKDKKLTLIHNSDVFSDEGYKIDLSKKTDNFEKLK